MKIFVNIDNVRQMQTRLQAIKTELKSKYANDSRIISEISQNIKSSEITPALQQYISENEVKSNQIEALFTAIDNFLTKQITEYSSANQSASDELSKLNSMLDQL